MKVLAVLFLSALAVAVVKAGISEDDKQAFRAEAQRCKAETGATDADVEHIIMHQPASSPVAKCLRACLMKQVNVLNADGKLVKEAALKLAELRTKGDAQKMAVSDEIAEICKNIPVSSDHCEAAEQYAVCFLEESKKRGISAVDF